MILVYLILAVHILPVVAIAAVELLGAWPARIRKDIGAIEGLSGLQCIEALDCMQDAYRAALKRTLFSATAPVAVFYALLFTRRADNRLPRLFWRWDNNKSINGDGHYVRRGGKLVHVRYLGWKTEPGEQLIYPDDPGLDKTARAYWAKAFHPRDFIARWVWLGLRNRASKYIWDTGVVAAGAKVIAGDSAVLNDDSHGWVLLQAGSHYQYYALKRKGRFTLRQSYGVKLSYVRDKEMPQRLPYTAIAYSLRKGS